MEDLYKPPESNVTLEGNARTYNYKLFKVSGIGVATFFGTVLAGGYLMYRNYRNLGQYDEAKKVLIWSVVAAVMILGIAFMIPEDINIPNAVLNIVQLVVVMQLAKKWFEQDLIDHELHGGAFASNWIAFGISLIILLIILAIVVAIVVIGAGFGILE